jgi:tetratricopeptide (TPR) repeat protein
MDFLHNLFGKKQPADISSAITDENTVFLQAEPISRKRMGLLWLEPSQLAWLQQQLAQYKVVDFKVIDDSLNYQNYEITQEDYEWVKQIERVVDKAYLAVQHGNYKESIQHYKKALELAPGCDLFLMSIGSCYAQLGEKAKAVQYLERAAQISPGNSRIRDNLNKARL